MGLRQNPASEPLVFARFDPRRTIQGNGRRHTRRAAMPIGKPDLSHRLRLRVEGSSVTETYPLIPLGAANPEMEHTPAIRNLLTLEFEIAVDADPWIGDRRPACDSLAADVRLGRHEPGRQGKKARGLPSLDTGRPSRFGPA